MKVFTECAMILLAACFFAVLAFEWAVGCGESYTDSEGVKHVNKCVFIGVGK